MPRPGVAEVLVPSAETFARTYFANYRFPAEEDAMRWMRRLPALAHKEDSAEMSQITVPTFRVLAPEDGADDAKALVVTQSRDPRSAVLGHLAAGALIGLADIVGTRAQLGRIALVGPESFSGAWVSVLRLDGRPLLERVLEETENMQLEAKLKAETARIAARIAAGDNQEPPPRRRSSVGSAWSALGRAQLPHFGEAAEEELEDVDMPPPGPSNKVLPAKMAQRATVTGGWRSFTDPIWKRQVFVAPLGGRATWGISEVLQTGGLDDLLLARCWEACVVDPLAVEAMKDPTWAFEIFADPSLSGEPIFRYEKGRLIVVQVFDMKTFVAHVVLPPPEDGGDAATGYATYRMRDGRPLLRSLMQPSEDYEGDRPQPRSELEPAHLDRAEPPEPGRALLEGPYVCAPAGGGGELPVAVGQDLGSARWASMPRGFRVRAFEEVVGLRARLPDIEGGGWVSLFQPDGRPLFWKEPLPPPVLEIPMAEKGVEDGGEPWLPVVWPDFGLEPRPRPAAQGLQLSTTFAVGAPRAPTLPDLLSRMGGGRMLCDWFRTDTFSGPAWRNLVTHTITTLHDLLARGIWKILVVEASEARVREASALSSKYIKTLPRSSLVIGEWIPPGNAAVRVLTPAAAGDPRPQHFWADLGAADGAVLVPLQPGGHFWVEPKGGHLADEQQEDENPLAKASKVDVRSEKDPASQIIGGLQRGDAVQIAEVLSLGV
ncbi:unnamed protein product [Prorocentrum cordatum]|uniref:Cyclic nucleotide-binding domain-containing protein n=1 Tax=Prorocentrum cordatum TaxID=2364126 RepID=A0ABN9W103_9DINO|nr:unnamed protein product [Polarella glacialis]